MSLLDNVKTLILRVRDGKAKGWPVIKEEKYIVLSVEDADKLAEAFDEAYYGIPYELMLLDGMNAEWSYTKNVKIYRQI